MLPLSAWSCVAAQGLRQVDWLHDSRAAFVLHGLLTAEECTHLAKLPLSFQSSYIGGASGRLDRRVRFAETAILFQARWKDRVHRNVTERLLRHAEMLSTSSRANPYLAEALPLSDRHLEFAQVTQYGEGGHYNWHSDGTPSPCGLFEWTGCRAFTAIVYLSELPAEGGGATAIQFDDGRVARVLPKLGSAVFFHSYLRHTGEQVYRGRKIILNQWIRFRPLPWLLYDASSLLVALEHLTGRSMMEVFFALERTVASVVGARFSVIVTGAGLVMFGLGLATVTATTLVLSCCLVRSSWRKAKISVKMN